MIPKQKKKLFTMISYLVNKEIKPSNTVSFANDVNMKEICEIRKILQNKSNTKPSYTSFMVKALAKALKEHPNMNRRIFPSFFGQKIIQFENVDIAVACEQDIVDAEMFAFMDTIRSASDKKLFEVHQQLLQLRNANESNNEQLRSMLWLAKYLPTMISKRICHLPAYFSSQWIKYRGAAAMISSPSKYGVDKVLGTWTHPLGFSFGFIKDRPLAINGQLDIQPTCTITLNFDRRINAGAPAAKFFARITEILENAKEELGYSFVTNDEPRQLAFAE